MATEGSPQSSTNKTEIVILHERLAAQSRNLLAEIDAFATHIISSPLVQHPETLINKFRTEITREAKLLDHHSSVLGLSPAASPPTEPLRQDQRPSKTLRKSINRVERLELSSDESRHRLRSSNIPHLSSLWQTAKQQSGITAIRKQVRFPSIHHSSDCPTPDVPHVSCRRNRAARGRVKLEDGGTYQPVGKTTKHGTKNREPVNVDLVCEHGTVWIKLFTKSLDWMAMDLAREGIVDLATEEVEHCSSNEEERTNGHLCQPSKDVGHGSKQKQKVSEEVVAAVEELKLVKMATEFLLAAKTARVDHWHPEVHFYLTRIERGASQDIDLVLEHIESKGISVKAANELSLRGSTNNLNGSTEDNSGTLDLTSTFAKMICPSPSPPPPTTTLNIDCTLLIALTSDISHLSPTSTAIPVHYTDRPSLKDIEQQFSSETTDPLLPNHIYPILAGKRLVCTKTAAAHLRNIVRVMGSEGETRRSNIFLPVGPEDKRGIDALREELRKSSRHAVPEGLQLPIEVIDDDKEQAIGEAKKLEEEVMSRLAQHPRLSVLNESVFFHGWRKDVTTVSLNRVVAEWLVRAIDGVLNDLEGEQDCESEIVIERGFQAPKVLICGRERSLLGNDKA